jgi:dipeptidyl-peptidase-4
MGHRNSLWIFGLLLLCAATVAAGEGPTAEDYTAAAAMIESNAEELVKNTSVEPHWIGEEGRFWYRRDAGEGHRYVVVDPRSGKKTPAFDHNRLAAALGEVYGEDATPTAENLGLEHVTLGDDLQLLTGMTETQVVSCDLAAMECETSAPPEVDRGLLPSPDGRWAAYARDDNLYVRDLESGDETRLTWDGEPFFSYGKLPDDTLVTIVNKKTGMVIPPYGANWSADGRFLIAPRIDERLARVNPFVEWVPTDGSLRPIVHEVRSPFSGDREQVSTQTFIFDAEKKTRTAIDLPEGYDQSMIDGMALGWSVGRSQAYLMARSMGATRAALLRVDLESGEADALIEETADTRFEANILGHVRPNIRILDDGDEVLWYSERTGWGHLYLYDAQTGELKNEITSGEWGVLDIHAIDERNREVFFTGGGREPERDPYFRHLYRASLDGGPVMLLTEDNADHEIRAELSPAMAMLYGVPPAGPTVRPEMGVFIDTYSTVDTPPVTVLRSTEDGRTIVELERADASALYEAGWKAPVREPVKAADGTTDIYTVYYAPNDGRDGGQRAVVDAVYGGAQVFVAPRSFVEAFSSTNPIAKASLARLGFAVTVIDGRGTPGRGAAFRDAGYPEFTRVGIEDHVAAVKQLAERHPEMDLERVGVVGWSWGGTFAAQAILGEPGFYDVAVSGAGVYDYAALNDGFKEDFIGPPVYPDGSAFRVRPDDKPVNWVPLDITAMAGNLKGKLLIVYGDMDENVPPVQAFRLIDALIKANKPYDLLYLPNRTHSGGGEGYTIRRTWDYFVEHLLDADPPADAEVKTKPPSMG